MMSAGNRDVIENAFGYFPKDVSRLSTAVLCDDEKAVAAALNSGANPNQPEPGGLTPVVIAAGVSRDAILRRLLKAGGDPNAFESDMQTLALSYALSAGVHFNDWRAYYTLLDEGADVNFSADGVSTIATWASALGQFEKVLELLDRGYRHDLKDLEGAIEVIVVSAEARPAQAAALARVRALIAAGEDRGPAPKTPPPPAS